MRSRSVAAITAVWLLVCGVLAARHEAMVAHVRNSAGVYVHASTDGCHDKSKTSHVHGERNPSADLGECALLTTFHQPVSAHVTCPTVVTTVRAICVQDTTSAATAMVATAVYRLAPKTSPPAAA